MVAHRDATGSEGPRESLERAVTPVRTSTLKDRGIESLRILSESQLLEILDRCMLAQNAPAFSQSFTPAPTDGPAPGGEPSASASAEVGHDDACDAEECRKAWEARHALQVRAVARLEAALQALSVAFEKLESLSGEANAGSRVPRSGKSGKSTTSHDVTQRRRRLARDMTKR